MRLEATRSLARQYSRRMGIGRRGALSKLAAVVCAATACGAPAPHSAGPTPAGTVPKGLGPAYPTSVRVVLFTFIPGQGLQPGTVVPASDIGVTAPVLQGVEYGLADAGALSQSANPAISADGGQTWRIDGPRLWEAAAQGPAEVSKVGATSPLSAYVWGRGGQFVSTTTDGGKQWWSADFIGSVYSVSAEGNNNLRALVYPALGPRTQGVYGTYVSTDGGRSWHFDG